MVLFLIQDHASPECTGGNKTYPATGVTVHTFTSSSSLVCSATKSSAQILVVGAGGSGGSHSSTSTDLNSTGGGGANSVGSAGSGSTGGSGGAGVSNSITGSGVV